MKTNCTQIYNLCVHLCVVCSFSLLVKTVLYEGLNDTPSISACFLGLFQCMQWCSFSPSHTHRDTETQTHMCAHTYTHTHTHAYTQTHTHTLLATIYLLYCEFVSFSSADFHKGLKGLLSDLIARNMCLFTAWVLSSYGIKVT